MTTDQLDLTQKFFYVGTHVLLKFIIAHISIYLKMSGHYTITELIHLGNFSMLRFSFSVIEY